MAKQRNGVQTMAPRQPDLTDPKVRAERRAAAERLVRDEAARRSSRRLNARSA